MNVRVHLSIMVCWSEEQTQEDAVQTNVTRLCVHNYYNAIIIQKINYETKKICVRACVGSLAGLFTVDGRHSLCDHFS